MNEESPDYREIIDDSLDIDVSLPPFPLELGKQTLRGQPIRIGDTERCHIIGVNVCQDDKVICVAKDSEVTEHVWHRDPFIRGSIVTVSLVSEEGEYMDVRFRFHKGSVYVGASFSDGCAPPDMVGELIRENAFWRD